MKTTLLTTTAAAMFALSFAAGSCERREQMGRRGRPADKPARLRRGRRRGAGGGQAL